jgi:hypothetical protein
MSTRVSFHNTTNVKAEIYANTAEGSHHFACMTLTFTDEKGSTFSLDVFGPVGREGVEKALDDFWRFGTAIAIAATDARIALPASV